MSEEDENDAVEEGSVITATAAAAEGTATMETRVREKDPGGSEDDTKVVVEEDGGWDYSSSHLNTDCRWNGHDGDQDEG